MRVVHHYPLCPYSRKVRLCLAEKKLDFTSEVENFWEKKPDYLKINPQGYVPALVDLNGSIILDSNAITEYLEEAYPDRKLYPEELLARAEVRRLINWFDTRFANEVSLVLLWEKVVKSLYAKVNGQRAAAPDSATIRHIKNVLANHLEYIAWLVDRRNWLAGDHFSMADITVAAHLSTVDYFGDINWDKFETVKSWFTRIKSRPSYRNLLSDKIPSLAPAAHYAELDF
jgi:glutathione S-transferase